MENMSMAFGNLSNVNETDIICNAAYGWAHNGCDQDNALNPLDYIYILISILGALGNGIVLYVYLGTRSLREQTTNVFIINLAVSDLITCILIIPFKVIRYPIPGGIAGEILCRMFISQYFLWTSGGASAYTLFWVTADRYYAIIHPMRYDQKFTVRRAIFLCGLSWALALALESYELVSFDLFEGVCHFNVRPLTRVLISLEGFCVLSVNLVMITVYTRIAILLRQKAKDLKSQGLAHTDPRQADAETAKRRVAKMMFIVLGCYFTCWVHVGVCNVWTAIWEGIYATEYGTIAMLLANGNSCMNPVIYCFQSNQFRKALVRPCKIRQRRNRTNREILGAIRSNSTRKAETPVKNGGSLDCQQCLLPDQTL